MDNTTASATGSHPVYNLARLRRDIGRQSWLGLAYTDSADGFFVRISYLFHF